MCFFILAWQRVVSAANYSFLILFGHWCACWWERTACFHNARYFLACSHWLSPAITPFWPQQNRIKWDWICLTEFQFLIPLSGHLVCRSGSASSAGPVTSKPVPQECFCCHKEQSRGKEITSTYLNGPCQWSCSYYCYRVYPCFCSPLWLFLFLLLLLFFFFLLLYYYKYHYYFCFLLSRCCSCFSGASIIILPLVLPSSHPSSAGVTEWSTLR